MYKSRQTLAATSSCPPGITVEIVESKSGILPAVNSKTAFLASNGATVTNGWVTVITSQKEGLPRLLYYRIQWAIWSWDGSTTSSANCKIPHIWRSRLNGSNYLVWGLQSSYGITRNQTFIQIERPLNFRWALAALGGAGWLDGMSWIIPFCEAALYYQTWSELLSLERGSASWMSTIETLHCERIERVNRT